VFVRNETPPVGEGDKDDEEDDGGGGGGDDEDE